MNEKPQTAPNLTTAVQQLLRALEWYGVDRKQAALHIASHRFLTLSSRICQENGIPIKDTPMEFTILGFRFVPSGDS